MFNLIFFFIIWSIGIVTHYQPHADLDWIGLEDIIPRTTKNLPFNYINSNLLTDTDNDLIRVKLLESLLTERDTGEV